MRKANDDSSDVVVVVVATVVVRCQQRAMAAKSIYFVSFSIIVRAIVEPRKQKRWSLPASSLGVHHLGSWKGARATEIEEGEARAWMFLV